MERISDGIYRLGSSVHNFYLYVEGGAATVVDAGGSKEWPALVKGLAGLGLTPAAVEGILLTHAHVDHIGFAARAEQEGIRTHTHPVEAEAATGRRANPAVSPKALPWWRPQVWVLVFALARIGATKFEPVQQVETAEDGEEIDLPGKPRLIATPGHTPGHAAFYFPGRRAVFTGDALVTVGLVGGPDGPQLMPPAFNADHDAARASLAALNGLDTELILPGHGRPVEGQVADVVANL